MRDEKLVALAATQFNRVARRQLESRGYTAKSIERRLEAGRLIAVEQGVFALPPVLDDPWGRWIGATLTEQDTYLSHESGGVAYGAIAYERPLITVTRPGNGGPRRHGGLLVYRRLSLDGEVGKLRGVAITCPERTLLDLACVLSPKALRSALRTMIRLQHTTIARVAGFAIARRKRRGARKLLRAAALSADLPIERARSGAEVQALIVFREAGFEVPALNRRRAGEEADLSWARHRLIVEVDGGPFHLDVGEDARKQAIWEAAGWTVRRIPASDVYDHPARLLALAPEAQIVPRSPL